MFSNIMTSKKFNGFSINSGKVYSATCLFSLEMHKSVERYQTHSKEEREKELRVFKTAITKCTKDLDKIKNNVVEKVGNVESEIFSAQKHIMNDPEIIKKIEEKISKEHHNAESAIHDVFSEYENKFLTIDNEYLKDRATDIGEIRRRLLDELKNTTSGFICEGQNNCTIGKDRIIVAKELTVDMITKMNLEYVRGFVTEEGGVSSHAAIIARSIGVPAVTGVTGIMDYVKCGSMLLVDGDEGTVYLNPDKKIVTKLISAEKKREDKVCYIKTPKGTELLANVSLYEDAKVAKSMYADGIGLCRTEIIFLSAGRLLSEDEQHDYYLKIMEVMNKKPVTFRLLDIGGDKPLPFLGIEKEANPYLGWRGSRFLLSNIPMLTTQLRALARLSLIGEINIMFPMVIDATQQKELLDVSKNIIKQVKNVNLKNIKFGTMFEVPSACIQAKEILDMVDFASIGSNDLIQYLFALDRENNKVAQFYDPNHPILWSVLKSLSDIAKESNKKLSICGEMATQKKIVKKLLKININSLSVSPQMIPRVRGEIVKYYNTNKIAIL